jgi:5-methyltetrahydropteroyltriglutamate--homocysteine methyltransferase
VLAAHHPQRPDARFDGGDLDCGGGLLLLIRQHIDPLPRGGLLEIRSNERSVKEDLPAWCRLTARKPRMRPKRASSRAALTLQSCARERPLASVDSAVTTGSTFLSPALTCFARKRTKYC